MLHTTPLAADAALREATFNKSLMSGRCSLLAAHVFISCVQSVTFKGSLENSKTHQPVLDHSTQNVTDSLKSYILG